MGSHYLVFVSGKDSHPLSESFLAQFQLSAPNWLHPAKAAEILLSSDLPHDVLTSIRQECAKHFTDVFYVPAEYRRKKLFLADMDATIVEGETLDDLAAQVGLKDKIAEITARAMRGELDFKAALEERVAMLKDLSETALEKTLKLMVINKGAIEAVQVMRAHGTECYLVSGGFTYFTEAIAKACGFNGHHGNQLDMLGGNLTGKVVPPNLDKQAKLNFLRQYAQKLGISMEETMAVGDGANDIPMLEAAGMGVGYHPKPLVREKISNIILHTDLTSLLYIQGYTWQDMAT